MLLPCAFALLLACSYARPSDAAVKSFKSDNYKGTPDTLEAHPVVFYKEDFVSEDYDPATSTEEQLNLSVESAQPTPVNGSDSENYRLVQPEKMYFDVLLKEPVVVGDDSGLNDSRFDTSKVQVEFMPLSDKENDMATSKRAKSKVPKKYHLRQRRDVSAPKAPHSIRKRNIYFDNSIIQIDNKAFQQLLDIFYRSLERENGGLRFPIRGVLGNLIPPNNPTPQQPAQTGPQTDMPMSIGDRFGPEDEQDRVPWGLSRATTPRPLPPRRTPPPLFHDSDPANADTSFLIPPSGSASAGRGRGPAFTTRATAPPPRRTPPPLFHDSDPANADTSFMN